MAEFCRKYGIGDATFYKIALEVWRARGVGGEATEELGGGEREAEALLADAMLDVSTLRDGVAA